MIRPFPFKKPASIVALHTTRKANGIDQGVRMALGATDRNFLVMVALVASYVPAQRAMIVEPLVALRSE